MANENLGYPEGLSDKSAAEILAYAEGQNFKPEPEPVIEGEGEGEEEGEQQKADKPQDEKEGASSGTMEPAGETKEEGKKDETLVPLSAVYAERDKARKAKEHTAALQARLDELEKAEAAEGETPETDVELLSDEEISALEEDFPQIAKAAKAIRALTGKIKAIETENRTFRAERDAVAKTSQDDTEAALRTDAQRVVDELPKLKHLQTSLKPEVWDARVVSIDNSLGQDPEFSQLPFDQRYAKLVEIYEYRYGPVQVPTADVVKPVPDGKPVVTSALRQKAEEAIRKAGEFKPRTLSDIPGGAPPASDSTENATELDLVKAFERMTPDQMEAALARVM